MKQKVLKIVGKKICSIGVLVSLILTALLCQVSAESSFTVTGYVKPDFIYEKETEPNILADFVIAIDATQISCVTDSKGYFKLTNVPINNSGYTFKISKAGYLTRVISNIPVFDNIALSVGGSPIDIWAGDLNEDNAINMSDVLEIAKAFNTVPSNENFSQLFDINRDVSVNTTDIMILAKHFNTEISNYSSNITYTNEQGLTPVATPTSTPTPTPTSVLDDMNYVSDTKSIHIKKYEQGTGEDMITYYVADVKVSQGSDILSAFAKNTFGLHITDKTTNIAKGKDAIFAINGSYYGFREDGIEIRNGQLYRDVPFRTGLAIYRNGVMTPYTEASDSATKLLENGVFQAISFGPVLVNSGTLITDFTNTVIDINSPSSAARRPIEGENPRTGIGMIEPNHYVFIVVDGRNAGYSRGATLTEFAKMFYDLGCKEAYNLDGGGSSTMYFNGKIINQPSLGRERSISDILYLTK